MGFTESASRRVFLRRMGQLGVAGVAAPWAASLAAMGEAAAMGTDDGYKALVCVFLHGGNDNGNTVIPVDAQGHADYARVRGALALSRASLNATTLNAAAPLAADGRVYALAPGLAPLRPVFDEGRLAVQLNVGPLIQPTTVAQYHNRSVPLPPKLFSHNDQQSVWQSSQAEGSTQGWGGMLGDLAMSSNATASNFTCISTAGNAVFLSGEQAVPYRVSSKGAIPIEPFSDVLCGLTGSCGEALQTLLTAPRPHMLENELGRMAQRALGAYDSVTRTLNAGAAGVSAAFAGVPEGNDLAAQLKVVAQMIGGRASLGVKRQVFMVSLGGFDTHDDMATKHPMLMQQLGQALGAFDQAMQAMGMGEQVTAFTASDFGRTLSVNDGGSDHGWGSHHLIVGGAVNGGQFLGRSPTTRLNEGEDVGRGALLPTTSVDQYAATLASWFGASGSDLDWMLPNLRNFTAKSLPMFRAS